MKEKPREFKTKVRIKRLIAGATRARGAALEARREREGGSIRQGRETEGELPCGEEGGAVAINFSSRD